MEELWIGDSDDETGDLLGFLSPPLCILENFEEFFFLVCGFN